VSGHLWRQHYEGLNLSETEIAAKLEARQREIERARLRVTKRRFQQSRTSRPAKIPSIADKKGQAERNAEIVRLRGSGMTYDAIAERFFITRERVRQIVKRAQRYDSQQRYVDQLAPLLVWLRELNNDPPKGTWIPKRIPR
jgi:DNA-binding CsgD family transcriptional regulator